MKFVIIFLLSIAVADACTAGIIFFTIDLEPAFENGTRGANRFASALPFRKSLQRSGLLEARKSGEDAFLTW